MIFKKRARALLLLPLLMLSGCNQEIGFGNYSFRGIHLYDAPNGVYDYEIASWHDDDEGCEAKLKDGNSIFVSEGKYMLYEDYCPICKK